MNKLYLALVAICVIGSPQASHALLIDDFSFGNTDIAANILTPSTRFIDNGPGILGGERESTAFYTGAQSTTLGNVGARINFLTDDSLLHNQDAGSAGGSFYIYDGDADVNTPGLVFEVDATGLGGIDLTAGGADRFIYDILFADMSVNNVLDMRVYTDETHYSDLLKSIGGPINSSTLIEFLFADFTLGDGALGAADFTNVGAILFLIDGRSEQAFDMRIDSIYTNDNFQEPVIPEPATLGLLGIGLAAMAVRRKMKKA